MTTGNVKDILEPMIAKLNSPKPKPSGTPKSNVSAKCPKCYGQGWVYSPPDSDHRIRCECNPVPSETRPLRTEPDKVYQCEICHDEGFFAYKVPHDHPDANTVFRCKCQSVREVESLLKLSSIPQLMFDMTWEKLAHRPKQEEAINALKAISAQPRGWLILSGPNGIGKSCLAQIACVERIRTGKAALYCNLVEFASNLKATFKSTEPGAEKHLIERYKTAPLLVLDEIDKVQYTSWLAGKLFELYTHRYDNLATLGTVIITNRPLDKGEPILPRTTGKNEDVSLYAEKFHSCMWDRRNAQISMEEQDLRRFQRW